jgi:hypothetical protein
MNSQSVAFDDSGQLQIYELERLVPTNPPLIESEASGTNDLDPSDVVGWSTDASGHHTPTVWTKTQTIRLLTLVGIEGEALDVNNKRQVVYLGLNDTASEASPATEQNGRTSTAP